MKKFLIILGVVSGLALIVYLIYADWRKKKDDIERAVYGGMTKREFLKKMKALWKDYYIDKAYQYQIKNIDYLRDTAVIHCKELTVNEKGEQTLLSTKWGAGWQDCAKSKIKENITNSYASDDPHPTTTDWAARNWLPNTLAALGIEYTNDEVQKTIKLI